MLGTNIITTIGSSTMDTMFYTDQMVLMDNKKDLLQQKLIGFEYGAKISSQNVTTTFGGGGANAAVNFASLGLKVQLVSSLGTDAIGQSILNNLKEKKVDIHLIQKNSKKITDNSFIVNVGSFNEHVIFSCRGAYEDIDLSLATVQKIKTPWIYLTRLSANFFPKLANIFEQVRSRKIKIAWNPGADQLQLGLTRLHRFMADTYVFDVNRDEALELIIKIKGKDFKNNINVLLKELHKFGQKLTVITDGPKGAYVYDGKKVHFHPALKRKGLNTTGAGDAFGSAFVAGLIRYHGDIEKSLRLGIWNSNSVIMKIGAQVGILTVADLKKHNL